MNYFTFGSSSSHSSSDHSSSGHSISGHSLPRHLPPDTTAYLHWRSVPLSTMYPHTISESSAGDSSSESFAGPSRKRCRSLATTMTSSIHATRALVPSRADLLPPRKRFRDSISPKDSVEEDIDTDMLTDIEADATANKVAIDRDVEDGVNAGISMEVDVGVNVEDEVKEEVESSNRGTIEVRVDVVAEIDIPDGMLMPDVVKRLEQLEARSLIDSGERASLLKQVASLEMRNAGLRGTMMIEIVRADRFQQRVVLWRVILGRFVGARAANALDAEIQSQNDNDGDNGNDGNRNGGDGNVGNGNGENGNGENENPNENNRGARPVAQECTYQDFMKCQPLNFKGIEGVWTIGTESASSMSWRELMKLMAEVFQELTMMCTKMVPEEEDRVEKFIGGLPNNIQGNGYTVKNTENKRRLEVNQRDNRGQQPPLKRQNVRDQNVARAYTAGSNEKRGYVGPLPYYNECKLHHEGPCTVRCGKYNKVGHMARDCKNTIVIPTTQRAPVVNQRIPTCS
ncbi:hypothetical protein Tco_0526931 [Tanacetum coccineum]